MFVRKIDWTSEALVANLAARTSAELETFVKAHRSRHILMVVETVTRKLMPKLQQEFDAIHKMQKPGVYFGMSKMYDILREMFVLHDFLNRLEVCLLMKKNEKLSRENEKLKRENTGLKAKNPADAPVPVAPQM